jgi:hypothetical protein
MTVSIFPPFPSFTDDNGAPLQSGFVYIGVANQNPITNPVAIFFDAALTVSAPNPLRTSGGFIVDGNGTPQNVYTAGDFSITVSDRFGAVLYTSPSYGFRIYSEAITFNEVIIGSLIVPDAPGGAANGTINAAWSSTVARAAQIRALSIYQDTQPTTAAHLARLSQLTMPLASCIYRVAPSLINNFNVASVTVNGTGDYNVNLSVACPLGVAPTIIATADTPVRQAIADIDVGRAFIHVTTFNTNSGAAADSGFHLYAIVDASVADPIL